MVRLAAGYRVSAEDREAIKSGSALFFTGKALAKADLICARQGRSEILWYWTALRSNVWVIDDVLLPDRQYASSGTCYAKPEMVLRVSRLARRMGRLILGAGHSHGCLGVFSSHTDLELMSQLAAERVGFASQIQLRHQGTITRLPDGAPAETPPASLFEITFDDNPQAWVTVAARGDLSEDDLKVSLDLLERHQVSFFTTHNADGERYFPVHHATSCLHCGTRLVDVHSESVRIHVIGPEELSQEEEDELLDELEEKAPRSWLFREYWGSGGSDLHQPIQLEEPADEEPEQAQEQDEVETAEFVVSRHNEHIGRIPAAILEEAAYRCPQLARALGWDQEECGGQGEDAHGKQSRPGVVEALTDESSDQSLEDLFEEPSYEIDFEAQVEDERLAGAAEELAGETALGSEDELPRVTDNEQRSGPQPGCTTFYVVRGAVGPGDETGDATGEAGGEETGAGDGRCSVRHEDPEDDQPGAIR